MIFTVEPGIYIDNDKGIDKGFHPHWSQNRG